MATPAASVARTRTGIEPQTSRIRVFIAGITPLGCELLERTLESHPRIQVVGIVQSEKDLLAETAKTKAELLLIKAALCEKTLSGLRVIGDLHASRPTLPIVLMCDHVSDDLVLSAFRAGVRGVLGPCESIETLCKCIQMVHGGQIWISNDQLEVVLGALIQAPPVRVVNAEGLSLLAEREGQVVALVAECLTNREIADRMGISEHTVANHLFRIYNKLGISNRMELVLYVMRQREQYRSAS